MRGFRPKKVAVGQLVELYTTDGVRLTGRYFPPMGENPYGLRLGYVVAHGFTGSSSDPNVQRICVRLNARGAGVLVMDFRGHGDSGGSSTIGICEELDLASAVARLHALGFAQTCAVGFSMGASVVIRYAARHSGVAARHSGVAARHSGVAARHSGVDAVVSVSGPALWYERGTRPMRRLHLGAETAAGRWALRWILHTRVGRQGWEELPESPVELVARIAPVPLLIVHGDADPYFPLRHPCALARAAPTAQVWIEPGMGHAESATSGELVDRIDAWVRSVI